MDILTNISMAQERVLRNLQDENRLLHETAGRDQHRLIVATQSLLQYINHLRHIDELRQSIELLLQGTLTPQLVPKLTLRATLLGIKREIERHFPGIHLVFDRAPNFYGMHNFRFGRHGHHLLILLQVPLTTFRHRFQLFKVTTFPVHFTGQQSHITALRDLPSYYGISREGRQYFTLDRDDNTVHPAFLFMADKQIDFHNLDTGVSCVSALLHNDIDSIHQFCTFQTTTQTPHQIPRRRQDFDDESLTGYSAVQRHANFDTLLHPMYLHGPMSLRRLHFP